MHSLRHDERRLQVSLSNLCKLEHGGYITVPPPAIISEAVFPFPNLKLHRAPSM